MAGGRVGRGRLVFMSPRRPASVHAPLGSYLRDHGILHFSAREVAPTGPHSTLKFPPADLWQQIVPTLLVLEDLRSHFGLPVLVTSGYRDAEYNRRIGGERRSLHIEFAAVDFVVRGVLPLDLARWLHGHERSAVLGIGLYDRFVHVDTRGLLGRRSPARWPWSVRGRWWV